MGARKYIHQRCLSDVRWRRCMVSCSRSKRMGICGRTNAGLLGASNARLLFRAKLISLSGMKENGKGFDPQEAKRLIEFLARRTKRERGLSCRVARFVNRCVKDSKTYPQNVERWLRTDRAKRAEPRLWVGLALLEAARRIEQDMFDER